MWDAEDKQPFFWNRVTHDSRWDLPSLSKHAKSRRHEAEWHNNLWEKFWLKEGAYRYWNRKGCHYPGQVVNDLSSVELQEGDEVFARFCNEWHPATVRAVREHNIQVLWSSEWSMRDLPKHDVKRRWTAHDSDAEKSS